MSTGALPIVLFRHRSSWPSAQFRSLLRSYRTPTHLWRPLALCWDVSCGHLFLCSLIGPVASAGVFQVLRMEACTAALLRVFWAACCFYRIPTRGQDCIVPVGACVVCISCSTCLSVPLVPGVCSKLLPYNFYQELQASIDFEMVAQRPRPTRMLAVAARVPWTLRSSHLTCKRTTMDTTST